MADNLSKLIELFNESNYDFMEYISDDWDVALKKFLEIVQRNERLNELDLNSILDSVTSDETNYIMSYFYTNSKNKEEFIGEICYEYIRHVEYKNEQFYFYKLDNSELSVFFCGGSGRHDITTQELVKSYYEEDWFERFNDTVYNIYNDVIEELNDDNRKELQNHFIEELKSEPIEPITDLLEMLNDGNDVIVSQENISEIFADEETVKYILNNYLEETKSNLFSLHYNSYNNAYEEEIGNLIRSELNTLFDMDSFSWDGNTVQFRKEYFMSFIGNYILDTKSSSWYDSIVYLGDIERIWETASDLGIVNCLDFRIPEWPDSSLVRNYLNEYFEI